MLKCRFLKIHSNARIPQKVDEKAVGFDLFPIDPFVISPHETILVPTGLVAIAPLGFYFELVLRSSTPIRYKGLILANHIGIIDPNYVGKEDEIKIALCNLSLSPHYITLDKPIAQLILRKNLLSMSEEISLEEHQRFFGNKSRGGFGSTDNK